MFGHERDRNDELVLDQLCRLKPPPFQLEWLEPFRNRRGQRSRIREHDSDALLRLVTKRLEATLALKLHRDLQVQLGGQPLVAPLSKTQRCSYTAELRVEQAEEPGQLTNIERAAERNPSTSQRFQVAQTVPGVQRARHRPRIICEQVSGVKTVSYAQWGPARAMPRIILASTSRYRRELLARLGLPFDVAAPAAPEVERAGESPAAMAARLALAKARSIRTPDALVIGSDQVAALDGRILRKPGTHEAAVEQLLSAQGRCVVFHTAVAVVATRTGAAAEHVDRTEVRFHNLERAALEQYVRLEQPLDCAGSFKSEGLGVVLFEDVSSHDPTALIGLPLIWLAQTLRSLGADPLHATRS